MMVACGKIRLIRGTNWKLHGILSVVRFASPPIERTWPQNHHRDWLDCIRNGGRPESNFPDFAGPLAEVARLGHVAYWSGCRLDWDAKNLKATNCPEADPLIKREPRKGWVLG